MEVADRVERGELDYSASKRATRLRRRASCRERLATITRTTAVSRVDVDTELAAGNVVHLHDDAQPVVCRLRLDGAYFLAGRVGEDALRLRRGASGIGSGIGAAGDDGQAHYGNRPERNGHVVRYRAPGILLPVSLALPVPAADVTRSHPPGD